MMRAWFITAIVSLGLVSCSSVKLPAKNQYQLMGINTAKVATNSKRRSILVTQPIATAGYQTNQMRYIEKPYQLASFVKNTWVATPADMLYPLVLQSLQNTHHFGAVESAPFSGVTDYRMDVRVLKLVQNFLKKPSQIEMVVSASVSNGNHRILASKTFYQRVDAPKNTPYGGVMAANIATANIMRQLASFAARATA